MRSAPTCRRRRRNCAPTSARSGIAVVASGDPLFYGTARYLCEQLGTEHFEVMPHVCSMQLAFARIKETWEEAYLTDLAARPLDDVLDKIRTAETVGLFTSETHHPARVAARTARLAASTTSRAYVCENLGGKDERITQGELAEIREMKFDPLNILILKRKPDRPDRRAPRRASPLRQPGRRVRPERGPRAASSPRPKCAPSRWRSSTCIRATCSGTSAPAPAASPSRPRSSSSPGRATPSSRTRPTIT